MRIAVFGARGFIGKEFVKIAPKEHKLFLFNRPEADIRKPESFEGKLKEFKPDVVVNLSALIGTLLKSVSVREMFLTNTMGSLDLAYASHQAGAKSYIYISSTVVHGDNKRGKHHGRFSGFAPKHSYSASKAAAEYALEQFAKEQKEMAVVTLRPPMVVGEGTPVPLPPTEFVQNVLNGKNIEIFGDGLHEREYVSVTDVAMGILKAVKWSVAVEKFYHPFFLTGNRISMGDLAEKVVKKCGGKVVYTPTTKQAFSLTTDPSDSKKFFGWEVCDNLDAILDGVAHHVAPSRHQAGKGFAQDRCGKRA